MAEDGAGPGRRRLQGGNARGADHLDAAGGIADTAILLRAVQKFIDKRAHGIDAGIAGADHRDILAGRGGFQRIAAACLLLAKLEVTARDMRGDRAKKVDIEVVANKLVRPQDQTRRLWRAPFRLSRPDADQHHPARLAPAKSRLGDGVRRQRQRHGGICRFRLWMNQRPVRPGRGKGRRLGDSGDADLLFDNLRRVGKARGLGGQRLSVENPQRHRQHRGKRLKRGLIRLQINAEDTGDGRGVDIGAGKLLHHQLDHLVGAAAARTANTKHHILRAVDKLAFGRGVLAAGDGQRHGIAARHILEPVIQTIQTVTINEGPVAGQQLRHDALRRRLVGKPPSGRRLVQRNTPAVIPGGGDGKGGTDSVCYLPRQGDRPVMAADKRHSDPAALGDGDDRRIRALVAQMRGDRPDQDAGGADSDHRPAAAEQVGDMRLCPAEMMRRVRTANGMTVDIGVNRLGKPPGKRQPGARQAQNDRLGRRVRLQLIHGSSPL